MRDLRLIEQATIRVGGERQPDLLWRVAEVLGRRVEIVDERIVTPQMRIDRVIGRVDGERQAAPAHCHVHVGRGRQMFQIVDHASQQGADAGVRRRWRLLVIGLVFFESIRWTLIARGLVLTLAVSWTRALEDEDRWSDVLNHRYNRYDRYSGEGEPRHEKW